MKAKWQPHPYHHSLRKWLFDFWFSFLGLALLSPIFVIIAALIKLTSEGPVFFTQKRVGKDSRVFTFIKFRTMVSGAERLKWRYRHLNEADGSVFKIRNDPRFTKVGKFLAKTGLDELPQFINVLKGDMSLVGPRPLPVNEAKKLTKKQKARTLVRPGITSSWVVEGTHVLSFEKWMQLDREYIRRASIGKDIEILLKTALTVAILTLR